MVDRLGGGILNNSISKVLLLLWLIVSVVGYSNAGSTTTGIECAVSAIGEDRIARIHHEQKRFFMISQSVDVQSFRELIGVMTICFSGNDWDQQWALSVFSEKKFAGYMDEPEIVPFHENYQWAKGYLAEYDSSTGILTLDPLISPRTIQVEEVQNLETP